jgi:hypothetical protein
LLIVSTPDVELPSFVVKFKWRSDHKHETET